MADPTSRTGSKAESSFSLICEEPRLSVEFPLRPGAIARIGSSEEVEVRIPLLGLSDEECSLFLDRNELLWLTRPGDELPIRMDPPCHFRVGPYRFTLRETTCPTAGDASMESHGANKDDPPSEKPTRSKLLVIAIVMVVGAGLAGTLFWVNRGMDRDSGRKTEASISLKPLEKADPPSPDDPASSPNDLARNDQQDGDPAESSLRSPNEDSSGDEKPDQKQLDLAKLADQAGPSVFLIQALDSNDEILGTGTGFAVSADGFVATNHHVVEKGARFVVVTGQGARFELVKVAAAEPDDDLAVLKMEAKGLPFLLLSETSDVSIGTRVVAYGCPDGLSGTISEGIISAKDRDLSEAHPELELPNGGILLQTTTPISPGSSGSPLLDAEGKVLGVLTLSGGMITQNLNFAVPVEELRPLIERARRSWNTPHQEPSLTEKSDADSLPEADKALHLDPEFLKLDHAMLAKDWVESLKIAGELIEKHPKSSEAYFHHAYCASMLRLDEQAKDSYLMVVKIDPDNYTAWNNLGLVSSSRGSPESALLAFEKAVSVKPDFAEGWDNALVANLILKDWPKATTALRTLAQVDLKMAIARAQPIANWSAPNAEFKTALKEVLAESVVEIPDSGPLTLRVTGIAAGDTLSIRSGPGTSYAEVTSVPNGTRVFLTGEGRMNGKTEWVPIEDGNFTGWAASKFLQPEE